MKKKLKTKKNELVFDVKQRELFLTGFSKRKRQRQRKAKEEIAVIIKKETKRIQEEAKNLKDKYKTSFRPIKELEESDESNEDDAEVYEFESNEVKVIVKSLETNKRLKKQEFVEEDVDMRQIKKPKSSFIKGMEMKGDDDEGSDDSVENEEKPEKLGFTGSKELKKLVSYLLGLSSNCLIGLFINLILDHKTNKNINEEI